MNYKKSLKKTIFYFILLLGFVISLFPFYFMIISSFKSISDIFTYPPKLYVQEWHFDNYVRLFTNIPFARNIFNSVFVALCFTIISVMVSAAAGFGLSKYKQAPGRKGLFVFILATMMIPEQVVMIPLYIYMSKIGWINTYFALILPFVAQAFGVFLLKQYIDGVPDDLLDSARIDGCNEFRIFWQIIMPIVKPALGALGIICFMNSYNFFLWPLIVTNKKEMLTVPVALANLQGQMYGVPYDLIMAGSTLATLPLIIIFLFFQKQFISGITMGALKE